MILLGEEGEKRRCEEENSEEKKSDKEEGRSFTEGTKEQKRNPVETKREGEDKTNCDAAKKSNGVREASEMGRLNTMEEMGCVYVLSTMDSPSSLSWALTQPRTPLLRSGVVEWCVVWWCGCEQLF